MVFRFWPGLFSRCIGLDLIVGAFWGGLVPGFFSELEVGGGGAADIQDAMEHRGQRVAEAGRGVTAKHVTQFMEIDSQCFGKESTPGQRHRRF